MVKNSVSLLNFKPNVVVAVVFVVVDFKLILFASSSGCIRFGSNLDLGNWMCGCQMQKNDDASYNEINFHVTFTSWWLLIYIFFPSLMLSI